MASKHFLKISVLSNFFDSKQLHRGEIAVESGHIKEMTPDLNKVPAVLKGKVAASMKTKTYDVEIHIDNEEGIVKAVCGCPTGRVSCHHMAALCIFARDNVSITDTQCSWNIAKHIDNSSAQKLRDLYPARRPDYVACKTKVSEKGKEEFIKNLATFDGVVGFTWLLTPEPKVKDFTLKSIEDILYSVEYINSQNKRQCFEQMANISKQQVVEVIASTVGQSANINWLVARKHRLTASHFGRVLSACKANKYPVSLFKTLLNDYNLDGVRAIQWGKENEPLALKYFESETSLVISPTGLWLEECGYIGATPDGLVGAECIVEVKCPYRFRNSSINDHLKNTKDYILYLEDGKYILNKGHIYYHQIQGQLYITKRQLCYLVLWTPGEKVIYEISKEDEWASNMNILKEFFITQFIEYLLKQ